MTNEERERIVREVLVYTHFTTEELMAHGHEGAAIRKALSLAIPEGSRVCGPDEVLGGAADIASERERQISEEGWTHEHDDQHADLQLLDHAVALIDRDRYRDEWGLIEKHDEDRRRMLVIAGALVAAEIDRMDRESAAIGESR